MVAMPELSTTTLVDGGKGTPVFDAVVFNQAAWSKELTDGSRVDLVFQLEANEWNGQRRLQLNVQDLRLTGQ